MTDPRITLATALAPESGAEALATLDGVRPIIRLGAGIDPQAATAAASLYSMLVRLYPHTVIDGDAAMGPNPWGVSTLAALPTALAAARPIPTRAADHDLHVGVGHDVVDSLLWLGGDEWTADVGRAPRSLSGGRFGLGPMAGAILVAAEITRIVLPETKGIVSFGEGLVWNMLDFRLAAAASPEVDHPARLAVAFLAAGSVNSSAVGVLCASRG